MDKTAIVISNYIDVDCDANTTPRQAYELGFRRAIKKCETVMHSRKIENVRLRELCGEYKAKNAKLRKLADAVKEFVEDSHCEDCPFRRDCDDNNRIFCADDFSYHAFAAMRELGIEVDD